MISRAAWLGRTSRLREGVLCGGALEERTPAAWPRGRPARPGNSVVRRLGEVVPAAAVEGPGRTESGSWEGGVGRPSSCRRGPGEDGVGILGGRRRASQQLPSRARGGRRREPEMAASGAGEDGVGSLRWRRRGPGRTASGVEGLGRRKNPS